MQLSSRAVCFLVFERANISFSFWLIGARGPFSLLAVRLLPRGLSHRATAASRPFAIAAVVFGPACAPSMAKRIAASKADGVAADKAASTSPASRKHKPADLPRTLEPANVVLALAGLSSQSQASGTVKLVDAVVFQRPADDSPAVARGSMSLLILEVLMCFFMG